MTIQESAAKKKAKPKSTPSFVCEIELRVEKWQADLLDRRFEAARYVYNAVLAEASDLILQHAPAMFVLKVKGNAPLTGATVTEAARLPLPTACPACQSALSVDPRRAPARLDCVACGFHAPTHLWQAHVARYGAPVDREAAIELGNQLWSYQDSDWT